MLAYRAAEATGQAFIGILKDHLQLIKQVDLLNHQVPLKCEQLDPIDEENVIKLIKLNKWGTLDDDAKALKDIKTETTTAFMSTPIGEDKPSSDEKLQSCSGQICKVTMESETTRDIAEAPTNETATASGIEKKPSSEAPQLQTFSGQICEVFMVAETTGDIAEAPKDETETATTTGKQSKPISEVEQSYNFLNWEAFIDKTPLKDATSAREPSEISRGEMQASEASIVTTISARPSIDIRKEAPSLDHLGETQASEVTTITTISARPSIDIKQEAPSLDHLGETQAPEATIIVSAGPSTDIKQEPSSVDQHNPFRCLKRCYSSQQPKNGTKCQKCSV